MREMRYDSYVDHPSRNIIMKFVYYIPINIWYDVLMFSIYTGFQVNGRHVLKIMANFVLLQDI